MKRPIFLSVSLIAVLEAVFLCPAAHAGNLVTNGDFSAGNTGFSSSYSFASSNTTEGQYGVVSNPISWNQFTDSFGDHTTGSGLMLVANGSPTANLVVWTENITVTPNTEYNFSAWVSTLDSAGAPANLDFTFNGSAHADAAPTTPAVWQQFAMQWNSGANTSLDLQISDNNPTVAGNDFGLDDISVTPAPVPEPSTWAELALGSLTLLPLLKRRKNTLPQA